MQAKSQQGIGFIGCLAIILAGSFVIILIMRIVPIYYEYYNLRTSLNALTSDPNLQPGKLTDRLDVAIKKSLSRYFIINSITSIPLDQVEIKPVPGGARVRAVYDVTTPLFANISLVIHFDDSVMVHSK